MSSNNKVLVKMNNAGYRHNDKWLVQGVSLSIERGKIVTLIGPNGSGKSTTAKIALGILKKNGEKLPTRDIQAYLVYPEGDEGRKFLIYENFKVIMKWNRSLFFGLSVGILSDMIEYY